MLEAKSQLSRLVKEALGGGDVVIASDGEPMVRLVPVAREGRLTGWGRGVGEAIETRSRRSDRPGRYRVSVS